MFFQNEEKDNTDGDWDVCHLQLFACLLITELSFRTSLLVSDANGG